MKSQNVLVIILCLVLRIVLCCVIFENSCLGSVIRELTKCQGPLDTYREYKITMLVIQNYYVGNGCITTLLGGVYLVLKV